MIKLLFVEDDKDLTYAVRNGLELLEEKYDIRCAENGKEALEIYKTFTPDVVVSDIEMPVMNGFELARAIREIDSKVIIILASGLTDATALREGYKSRIDEYIKKPYVVNEIHYRVQAILRRMQHNNSSDAQTITTENATNELKIGKYSFNHEQCTLSFNNKIVQKLTSREADILALLCENQGDLVLRSDILQRFWENDDPAFSSRSLDVFITKLRKYLSEDEHIKLVNEKGKGLKLTVDE